MTTTVTPTKWVMTNNHNEWVHFDVTDTADTCLMEVTFVAPLTIGYLEVQGSLVDDMNSPDSYYRLENRKPFGCTVEFGRKLWKALHSTGDWR